MTALMTLLQSANTVLPQQPAALSEQDPLASMHDIILPEPVHSYPIALGYWLLLLLILVVGFILLRKVIKSRRYHAPRKEALNAFKQLDETSHTFAADVNQLLKRVAMTYLPREDMAKLNGQPWFKWLGTRLPAENQKELGELLVKRHHAKGLSTEENQALAKLTMMWLQNKAEFTVSQRELSSGDTSC